MGTVRKRRKFTIRTRDAGSFEWAEALLADTGRLTPEQVALVPERNPDTPLTRALRHYLIRLKRRDRRPGVKPKNAAAWEFILFDANALYDAKLREYRDSQSSGPMKNSEQAASEHAYKAVLTEIKAGVCDMDWTALRNLISLRTRDPELFFELEAGDVEVTDDTAESVERLIVPKFINDNAEAAAGLAQFCR